MLNDCSLEIGRLTDPQVRGCWRIIAIALGVFAFTLAPIFDFYIAPSQLLIPVIEPLIPASLVYKVVPEGGAPAGVLLILISAIIFWTLAFGVTHFIIGSIRRRASAPAN